MTIMNIETSEEVTQKLIDHQNETARLFEYIVEDPFYSTIHNSMVKVDDFSNMYHKWNGEWELHTTDLTDGMIRVLYKEWYNHQLNERCSVCDVLSIPNPSQI